MDHFPKSKNLTLSKPVELPEYLEKLNSESPTVNEITALEKGTEMTLPVATTSKTYSKNTSELRSNLRENKKEIKEELKDVLGSYEEEGEISSNPETNLILMVILAILIPPLAVAIKVGVEDSKFWISLLLTLLFWLPGVIYALWVIGLFD